MAAFVKKLVEKASLKKPGGISDTLKPDDVDPRLVFHYGIPPGSLLLEYNSNQQILAISTKDGRIKFYGKDGSQALLESSETVPSKNLLFMEYQGVLVNVNVNNHIEVWDTDTKCWSTVHRYEKDITSLAAMQHAPFLYVGDSSGDISVLKVDQEQRYIGHMKYHIPFSASHGKINEVESEIAAKYVLHQPTAETKRVLIIYCDGVITLWAIQESTAIFTSVSTTLQSLYHETKKVTAACWASTDGTKVAVGYSNGDILLWGVPCPSDSKTGQVSMNEMSDSQITPVCKLNLGYKADKIPISKLKWTDADGKSSRLYVLGCSDNISTNLLQVVLLNEHTESRTIKLALHPPESVVDLEIISSSIEQKRHNYLLLLGKLSHIYTYDDCLIERYLLQCQNKSSSSLPKEQMIKLPYGDSSITVTKFITSIPSMPCSSDEEFNMVAKNSLALFPFERKLKDGNTSNSTTFSPFSKAKNLFISGHDNGAIHFWDASCPLLLQVASVTQQSDDNFSVSGCPLTALHFDLESHTLVSGDQSGMVRLYIFKSETFAPRSSFVSFQGISKKGSNHIIDRIKLLVKVNGSVLSLNMTKNLKQLAVGSDQGYVSLVDVEGATILYQRLIASEFSKGVISTHFETCSFHGFEKTVLLVASKDSSVLALERDSGNPVSSGTVRPKKPSRALYTQILDVPDNVNSDTTITKQSLVLLCSEKAVYIYSLSNLVQGVKKVLYKKKFTSSCFWASTFGSSDDGLVLLFTSGRIEIRSLPELSLAKESLIRGFSFSTLKSPSTSDIIVSSSQDGELIIVNGNQEILFVSTLLHKEAYRLLDSVTQVFNKDLVHAQECIDISSASIKEKKRGILGSMVKDNKGTKSKIGLEMESQYSRRSIEELSTVFSKSNFAIESGSVAKFTMNEEDMELDIDDIDIEDLKEKPRGYPVIAGLNKQNITNKFQAIKGKLKFTKFNKNEKVPPVHDETQDEKTGGAIDQIKKKYGYSSSGESSDANIARSKLSENMRKLQGINMKATEMQDTAQSFYSMAREVLRFAENDKKGGS